MFRAILVWLANKIPNSYRLKSAKSLLLYFSGIKLNIRDFYFISPIFIDEPKSIAFGDKIFINSCVKFEGRGSIQIGSNIQIGPNVVFTTTNHSIPEMNCNLKSIVLRDNIWIGAGSIIIGSVSLGPNLVIGAGSVVTKNFENCVIAGNPAKKLKDL